MKIRKVNESIDLKEAAEDKIPDIDPKDSVAEIADAIADQVEIATGEEKTVADSDAKAAAKEVKQVGDEIDAGAAVVATDDSKVSEDNGFLDIDNKITRILDDAYNNAKKNKRRGLKSGSNVLIIGLPGSGKTASVEDWARSRGINLVAINAKNNDLEAYINGYTVRDAEDPTMVTQAYSNNLAKLELPNSVLFLDEYNRQVKPQIRASLYTLINEHKISGKDKENQHVFKNLLFTIACINPALPTDKGAAPLNDAEMSRFLYILDHLDSDPATCLEYLNKQYDKLISKLDKNDPYYKEDLEDYLRIQDLGSFILSDYNFKFDDESVLRDLADEQKKMFNQRAFTEGLVESQGDPDKFADWVKTFSGFLQVDIDLLLEILSRYTKPTLKELCQAKKIDTDGIIPEEEAETAAPEEPAKEEEPKEEEEIEDDDDFFANSGVAGTAGIKTETPNQTIANIIAGIDAF